MAYTKTIWNEKAAPGISGEKLNKMEQGIYDAHERITNMQNIPSGSTTADAALYDINIGFDGTDHKAPGDSVRAQARQLDNKINEVSGKLSSEIVKVETRKQTVSKPFVYDDIFVKDLWESGAFDSSGNPSKNTARLRTKDFLTLDEFVRIACEVVSSGYQIACYFYKTDGTFIGLDSSQRGYISWSKYNSLGDDGDEIFPIPSCKYKFVVKRDDNTNMSIDEILNVKNTIHLVGYPKKDYEVSTFQFGGVQKNHEYNVAEFYFRKGNIASGGIIAEKHNYRFYTPQYYYFAKGTRFKCNPTYRWGIHFYSEYGNHSSELLTDGTTDFVLEKDGYYRLLCYESPYNDNTTLADVIENVFIYGSDFVSKEYVDNEIENVKEMITHEEIDNNFDNEIQSISDKVLALQNKDTFTFAFIPDLHFDISKDEHKKMYERVCKAIKYLSDNANLSCVVLGGDNVANVWFSESGSSLKWNKYSSQYVRRKLLEYCGVPLLIANGNHDDNSIYDASYNGNTLNKDNQEHIPTKTVYDYELYNYYCKHNENSNVVFGGKGKMYYYVDFPTQKIRLFVLNSIDIPYELNENNALTYTGQWTYAYRNEQLNFVANALKFSDKENPSEWSVIFTKHMSIEPTMYNDGNMYNNDILVNIINAYANGTSYSASLSSGDFPYNVGVDYEGVRGNIIADIAGHYHADRNGIYEGIPYIITNTARYENRTEESGEVSNTSFDVFTIDTNAKTIKATKFGYGSDREFSY